MKKAGFNPRALFAASEQGVWYDPSDMSAMYQDAAGTTPVYMPGQGQVDPPVGLLLDNQLGLARGPERLVNGDFSAGAANWSVSGNDATHIATFSGGALRFQSDTTSPVMLVQQLGAMVIGRWYEITVTVSAWVSGSLKSDNFVQSGLTLASGAGVYKVIGLSSGTAFAFLRASANVDLTIDSISIREVLGNHAYQTTTTSRPALSGRYNLLTNTNFSGAVVGAPGTPPTGWSANFSTASITAVAPLGSDYAIQITANAQRLFFGMGFTALPSTTYSLTCFVVENSGLPMEQILGFTGVPIGATLQWYLNGGLVNGATTAPVNSRIEVRLVVGATGGTPAARVGIGTAINATGVVSVASPDVRVVGDGVGLPPYQRVVDANTYDTLGFPLYLCFDGVDDSLQTASVDFSGTDKLFVSAALRKLSDAAAGMLLELSPTLGSNSGTFYITAPGAANTGNVKLATKGTTEVNVATGSSAFPSPASVVASAIMDIAAQLSTLRVNGAVAQTSSSSLGTGALGNYPIYIGRRAGTSLPFNGRLYSLLIRGAATPDATIATVERYLNSKARIY